VTRIIRPVALAAALILAAASASPAPDTSSAPPAAAAVEVSIRFYDKRIYFPDGEILIKVTISNVGPEVYRFKLADDRVHSLSFEARTQGNLVLDPSDGYRLARSEPKPAFYRELSIKPGEEYSFVDRLERFVRIDQPGIFSVKASFFPELAEGSPPVAPIASNILMLSIRPSPGLPPAREIVAKETGEILKAQALPPDEVVRRTIVARQRSSWNEFFLYLDLPALMARNPDQKLLYDRESDEGRRRMIERYRAELQTSVVGNDIVTIPFYFEIVETKYSPSRGLVRVLEKFQDSQLRIVKEYSYELQRRDEVWFIVGYSVLNKGTE
jgi:hypothetical protein